MKKISPKAIIVGGITDIVGTNVLLLPLIIYVMTKADLHGVPKDQMAQQLISVIQGNPVYFIIQIIIGCTGSVLGGYVAAKIAKHDEKLNGALSSFLCVSSSIYGLLTGKVHSSLLMAIVELPVSPMMGWLGGYLYAKRKQRLQKL